MRIVVTARRIERGKTEREKERERERGREKKKEIEKERKGENMCISVCAADIESSLGDARGLTNLVVKL